VFKNIKNVAPKAGESYFIDTNVWYFCTYAASKDFFESSTQPKQYQMEYYPTFVESAIENEAQLYCSALTLVELSTLIERSQWELYKSFYDLPNCRLKEFRKIDKEREEVIEEIKIAWETIMSMSSQLTFNIDEDMADNFIKHIEKYEIDGYDALFYEMMDRLNISSVITDDKDFRQLDNLITYTCYPD
jgi:predicted nucleic acid-binding protein